MAGVWEGRELKRGGSKGGKGLYSNTNLKTEGRGSRKKKRGTIATGKKGENGETTKATWKGEETREGDYSPIYKMEITRFEKETKVFIAEL